MTKETQQHSNDLDVDHPNTAGWVHRPARVGQNSKNNMVAGHLFKAMRAYDLTEKLSLFCNDRVYVHLGQLQNVERSRGEVQPVGLVVLSGRHQRRSACLLEHLQALALSSSHARSPELMLSNRHMSANERQDDTHHLVASVAIVRLAVILCRSSSIGVASGFTDCT